MATIVKRNAASKKIKQPETAAPVTPSKVSLTPTGGTGASPAGWFNDVGHDARAAAFGLGNSPSAAIGFNAPSAAVTQGIVGSAPPAEPAQDTTGMPGSVTTKASRYTTRQGVTMPERTGFVRSAFATSPDTDEYYDLMRDAEGARPDPFQSRYEGAIQSILDGIMNRKSFDINSDSNYQQLYNLYAQRYQAQADRAMQESLGNAAALSGGYGSTAATAAAGQAYDRAMEGLNDQNLALMQMAYQMYGDETADRYNRLGAVTNLDNTDYGRYRDTVNDWLADRAYYANQYQNMYGNDWNQYAFNTNLDWSAYQDALNRDWAEYSDQAEREYRGERDAKSDYDSAFNKALSLAQNGMGIPAAYGSLLEDDTLAQLNALAAQVQAEKALAAAGGGGGGGRGGRRGGSGGGSDYDPGDILAGSPFKSDLGLVRDRNEAAVQVNRLIDNGANADDVLTYLASNKNLQPEQRAEIAKAAGAGEELRKKQKKVTSGKLGSLTGGSVNDAALKNYKKTW